jgi:hypothetical protein
VSKQFRVIRPEDMTKLKQITKMALRGYVTYAAQIGESIDEPVAREVADALVGKTRPRAEVSEFAEELRQHAVSRDRLSVAV